MRYVKLLCVALLFLPLAGCADLFEDYVVASEVVVEVENGAYILQQDWASAWDGSTYSVWTAHNPSSQPMCAQVDGEVSTYSGATWGGVHEVPPYGQATLARIGTSGRFSYEVDQRIWSADYYGNCYGYPED